jgi:MYXO-CTERM domain-containing protein
LCQACTAKVKGAGADGYCGSIAAGTDPEDECNDSGIATCQTNGFCDGAGACQLYPSATGCTPEPCTRGDQCTSGHCEDGICCDRTCAANERCKADLKVSGGDGVCGPAKAAALGAPCEFDVQCTSGRCGGGVCCDTDCEAAAKSGGGGCGCRASGSPGPGPHAWLGVALAVLVLRRTGGAKRRLKPAIIAAGRRGK